MAAKPGNNTYRTLLAIVAGLLIFSFLLKNHYLVWAGIGVCALGLLSSWLADKIAWLWLKLSDGLGWFNSKVLLGAVFIVVLVPIAFLSKLFKKDSLNMKDKGQGSLFKERNHVFEAGDLENTW